MRNLLVAALVSLLALTACSKPAGESSSAPAASSSDSSTPADGAAPADSSAPATNEASPPPASETPAPAAAAGAPPTTDSAQGESGAKSPSAAASPGANPRKLAADGAMCGGIAGIACGEGSYCAMDAAQCKIADGAGVCKKKAEMCTQQYAPVCGCNGKTYGNSCQAASAGANVAASGECK